MNAWLTMVTTHQGIPGVRSIGPSPRIPFRLGGNYASFARPLLPALREHQCCTLLRPFDLCLSRPHARAAGRENHGLQMPLRLSLHARRESARRGRGRLRRGTPTTPGSFQSDLSIRALRAPSAVRDSATVKRRGQPNSAQPQFANAAENARRCCSWARHSHHVRSMTIETYKSPNGLRFTLKESDGCGVWECLECGQRGYTPIDDRDRLNEKCESGALEHSHVCPAQRGASGK